MNCVQLCKVAALAHKKDSVVAKKIATIKVRILNKYSKLRNKKSSTQCLFNRRLCPATSTLSHAKMARVQMALRIALEHSIMTRFGAGVIES